MIELFRLALPIVLMYLGTMTMGLVDLIFVGRLNSTAIGAVGVGTSLFSWFMVIGLGLGSGMEFLVSRAHGAREAEKKHRYLVQGLWLSTAIAIPLTGILLVLSQNLAWFGINPAVIEAARDYTWVLSLSLSSIFYFNLFRLYLTAMGIAQPAVVALIAGNILNILLNYTFVFGHFGSPALGVVGSAWSTVISRAVMMLGLGFYVYRWDLKNDHFFRKLGFRFNGALMRDLIKIGTPASLQMVFEVGGFVLATTLAGRLSPEELAAHQVVLNTASMTFMVPLGVGSATAVLVGQAIGRKDQRAATRMGWKGFILGVGFMAFSCLVLLLFPDLILRTFTVDPRVIEYGKSILVIAALFQLSDGTQTVGTGALRGTGETKSSMIFNLAGHWLIGLPLGTYLGFYLGWGLRGLWIGLSAGLTVVAMLVLGRWIAVRGSQVADGS